jgi:hypothetical protein
VDLGEKVLERLATSDKTTIVIEKQPDGKMRVKSGYHARSRSYPNDHPCGELRRTNRP